MNQQLSPLFMSKSQRKMTLLELPDIVLRRVFLYLSYDEVARLRVVNKAFNNMGKDCLNKGLIAVEKFRNLCLREVKIQLPRRESERRVHPLARHVDVLMAIETRISMLSMTYGKYIDSGLCCFIPGKVLDEMFRVLRIVRESKSPPRPHEILQELRDISSMAMEHFDEKVCTSLKPKFMTTPRNKSILALKMSVSGSDAQDEANSFQHIQSNLQKVKSHNLDLKKSVKGLRAKVSKQSSKIEDNRNKLQDQSAKISEQSAQIQDLRRIVDELSQKVLDISRSPDSSLDSKTKSKPLESKSGASTAKKALFSSSAGGVVTRSKRGKIVDGDSQLSEPAFKRSCKN